MNDDSQQGDTKAHSAPTSPRTKKIGRLLKAIPMVGEFLETIWLDWGWVGSFLLVCGFLIAVTCVYFGKLPTQLIVHGYPCADCQRPAGEPERQLTAHAWVPWPNIIDKAKHKIRGSGLALSVLNPETIINKVAHRDGITAEIVMVNPCGRSMQERNEDERNTGAGPKKVLEQLNGFNRYASQLTSEEEKQQVKESVKIWLVNAYPTMNMLIVDEDLYAYFCIYGRPCAQSPVLSFKDYKKNDDGQYFASQLDALFSRKEKNELTRFLVFGNPDAPILKKPDKPIDCDSLAQFLEK